MNPSDFKTELAGRVVKTPTGYWAFVPAPLPPALDYGADLALLLSRADAALSELSGLGRYLPNPDLLIALYVKLLDVIDAKGREIADAVARLRAMG
jgi:hypothetical protein